MASLLLPSSMAVSGSAPVFARSNSTSIVAPASKILNRGTKKDDKPLGFAGISNGSRLKCMQVVNPFENKRFETLSYLPPLSSEQIAKQIDYIVRKGWIPCLEFDKRGSVFRENSRMCGYYDGRYWTMWKLPMFGCQDTAAVLREVEECRAAYPDAFIRMMAYDNVRQVQCVAFLVHRPSSAE